MSPAPTPVEPDTGKASLLKTSANVATTLLIVNVVQHITGWNERWFCLMVAVGVAAAASWTSPKTLSFLGSAVFRGFLIYATAFGVQNTIIAPSAEQKTVVMQEQETIEHKMPPGVMGAAPSPSVFEMRTKQVEKDVIIPEKEKNYRSGW